MSRNIQFELYYNGQWNDLILDSKVFADQPITITRGSQPGSGGLSPTVLTAKLNNNDDMLRTTNPLSPLYGLLGRSVPLRVTVDGSIRAVVDVNSIEARQTKNFRVEPLRGKSWVDIEGYGVIGRINEWQKPLRSPFYRYNTRLSGLAGYWPLEDANGTQRPEAFVSGSSSGAVNNLLFGSQSRALGSAPVADVNAIATSTEGYFAPVTSGGLSTDGWQISWLQRLQTFDPAETYNFMFWETSNGASWSLLYSAGNLVLLGTGAVSVSLSAGTSFDFGEAGWTFWDVEAAYSGGTTTIEIVFRGERDTGYTVASTSYSGVTGTLNKWFVSTLTARDLSVGHILGMNVTKDVTDLGSNARITAAQGHLDEVSSLRVYRLINDEFALGAYVGSNWADSTPMGAQQATSLSEVLAECITTDDAIIKEYRPDNRLIILGRHDRINQTPKITLDVKDLIEAPAELLDHQNIWNKVTVTTPFDEDITVEDTTSPLSTQAYPDGIGERSKTINVNPAENLEQHANWWLRRGTVDRPRYPVISVNLDTLLPDVKEDVLSVDVGDVIVITGYRENDIRLHVVSYTEVITWPTPHIINFVCVPDDQFITGIYDSTTSLWALSSCTLSGNYGPNDTTLTFTMTADESWSSTSTYDLLIQGERITIPIGAMAARTGTGPYTQVATGVIRGVNGIRKSLTSGAVPDLVNKGRWII